MLILIDVVLLTIGLKPTLCPPVGWLVRAYCLTDSDNLLIVN